MATPVIETYTTATGSASSTAHSLTMPASLAAGNVLLALVAVSSSSATLTITPSTGWFTLAKDLNTTIGVWTCAFFKIAVGSDTLTVSLSAATACEYTILQVSGANIVQATLGATTLGTGGPWAPTLILPAYAKDYLYLTAFFTTGDAGATPTVPSSYTLVTGARSSNGSVYVGNRTSASTASAESPGQWTYTFVNAVIMTFAIYQAPVIAGTILDTAGDPLAVSVYPLLASTNARLSWSVGSWTETPAFTSLANGTFAIPIVNPQLEYNIWVKSPDSQYADFFFSRVRVDLE